MSKAETEEEMDGNKEKTNSRRYNLMLITRQKKKCMCSTAILREVKQYVQKLRWNRKWM
jgi:hypothetical protein